MADVIAADVSPGQTLSVDALVTLTTEILTDVGMRADEAARAAHCLVFAQRSAIDSHGLMHLPSYVSAMLRGSMNPRPVMQFSETRPGTAVLDGGGGLGALVGLIAADRAMVLARGAGIGLVAVRNSGHFGAASAFADHMAGQGCVCLILSNASPTTAPWGGTRALLGTNPIAAGFPRRGSEPIIVDMATTAGSRARIRKAATNGEPIPEDWALDGEGRSTTDPNEALAGTMLPMAGAKGSALALMVECLCVGLAGGVPGRSVRPPQDESGEPSGVSHVFLAIDPAAFGGLGSVAGKIDDIARAIQACPPVSRDLPVRLPGSRAAGARAERDRRGILLTEALWSALQRASQIAKARKASGRP